MDRDVYRISVRVLENGYVVEVPDFEEVKKKREVDKKAKRDYPSYIGDCTKSFAAKSTAQVVKLVKEALDGIPEAEYDSAFSEAAKSAPAMKG